MADHFDRDDLRAFLAYVKSTVGGISSVFDIAAKLTETTIDDRLLAAARMAAVFASNVAALDDDTLDMIAGVVDSVLHALGHHSKDQMVAALRSSLSHETG